MLRVLSVAVGPPPPPGGLGSLMKVTVKDNSQEQLHSKKERRNADNDRTDDNNKVTILILRSQLNIFSRSVVHLGVRRCTVICIHVNKLS